MRELPQQDFSTPAGQAVLASYLRDMAEELSVLYTTTAPNGNISAERNRIALYNNSGAFSVWINTDGGTTWQPISVLENRTSDPSSPVTGEMWIRTDV